MTTLTESIHPGQGLISEANGMRSRDAVTIKSGEGVIAPGQVLGKVTGDLDTVAVAAATFVGTGNGTLTRATPAYGAGVQPGVYRVVAIEGAANAGTFAVFRPDGTEIGQATVGVAFTGEVKFTIADGSTDFIAGDAFSLSVTITDAKEYRSCDPTNTDGSQVAAAIAIYGCDATSAAQTITAAVRSVEWDAALVTWDANLDTTAERNAAKAQLAAAGIILR